MARRTRVLALQTCVTVALLWAIARRLDWSEVAAVIARAPASVAVLTFVAIALGQLLYVCRWKLVLHGMGRTARFTSLVRYTLMGLLFSNLLPGAIGGDGARLYYLGRQLGYADAAVSLAADRVLGLLSLVVFANVLAWTLPPDSGIDPLILSTLSTVLAFTVLGIGVALAVPVRWFGEPNRWAGPRLAGYLRYGGDLLGRLRETAKTPYVIVGAMVLTVGNVMLTACAYQLFFAAVGAASPAWAPLLLALTAVAVLINVPISLNGIGLREQLHIWILGGLSISQEVAVGASVTVFIQLIILSLIGLGVWLHARLMPDVTDALPGT